MSIFFKKKKGNLEENGFSNKSTAYFKSAVESGKLKIAGWLDQKTSGYSPGHKKAGLIIFCAVFGGLCFYLLTGSIRNRNADIRRLVITRIPGYLQPGHSGAITDSVYHHIEKTKLFLDSLRKNDTLKYKAILLARPGLPDNIRLLEQIYQSEKK
jgi:hypothetical protein